MTRERRTARDVLNELRWREGRDIRRAEIWFADRTKPEGYRIISGEEITELGRGYFTTGEATLPYYKIMRVEYDGEVLFERGEIQPKRLNKPEGVE